MKKIIIALCMALVMLCPVQAFAMTAATREQEDVNPDVVDEKEESAPQGCVLDEMDADGNSMSTDKVGAITYTYADGVLTIKGKGAMADYTVEALPEWNQYADSTTSIVVGSGITYIGGFSFYGFSNVTSVKIAKTVTELGRLSFGECSSLVSISLPNSVEVIGEGAFYECTALQSIKMPGVTLIKNYAFQGCKSFDNFEIPAGLTFIGFYVFYDGVVNSFSVAEGNSIYTAKNGVLFMDKGKTLVLYPSGSTATSYKVPASVTTIMDAAFVHCMNLKTINLRNVAKIGQGAFQDCGLEKVVLPDSLTDVGYFAFFGCKYLKSVTFGNGLKMTSYQMFRECPVLETIDFGTYLSELDAHTFAYCDALKEVVLPKNIKKMGNGCFGCSGLEKITMLGIEDCIPFQAFLSCKSLKELVLNEGVTTINRVAFYYCNELDSVTIPASVTYVHEIAFPRDTVITCKNKDLKPFGCNGYCRGQYVTITGENDYANAYKVLELLNAERERQGLDPLVMEQELLDVAMMRAAESALCFSHTRPDSSTCMSTTDKLYAENIAIGQGSPEMVFNAWLESDGHRTNMMNSRYNTVGIGCFYHNGIYMWVQCFGVMYDVPEVTKPANETHSYRILMASDPFTEAVYGTGVAYGESKTYEYNFKLNLENDVIGTNENTQVHVAVLNAGFPWYAKLDLDGIRFKSSDVKVATVSKTGLVTGVSKGTSKISLVLPGFKANTKVGIEKYVNNDAPVLDMDMIRVTFHANGGKALIASKHVNYNEAYGYLLAPKRKGYQFKGWYTAKTGGEKVTAKTIVSKKKAHTIYAQWKKITVKKAKVVSAKMNKKNQLIINAKQMKGVAGYQYQIATNKTFKKNMKKVFSEETTVTFENVKSTKTYYVRVRAYKIDSAGKKVYGKWSKIVTVKLAK